jgi:hypothetical protein
LGYKPDLTKSVLPSSVVAARKVVEHYAAAVAPELRDGCIYGSIGVVTALNFYACAGFASKPIDSVPAKTLCDAAVQSCKHISTIFVGYPLTGLFLALMEAVREPERFG